MSRFKIDGRTKLGKTIKAAQMLTNAMHSPDFSRQLRCWSSMRRNADGLPDKSYCIDAGYCLDRTEIIYGHR